MIFDLQEFKQEIETKKKFIDSCLDEYMRDIGTYPELIHDAMRYAVFNGGKRLRPILVLEGAAVTGGNEDKLIPAACAMEMIHTYSLVHDDLPAMDDDDFRRGKPTCHKVYGEANAILTGDALLTIAFAILSRTSEIEGVNPYNLLKLIEVIAEAAGSKGMIGGQVIDLESEGKKIDYPTLKTMHALKTGELFRASVMAGAILNGADQGQLEALSEFAYNFGLAFQITDDILDVRGNEELIGKAVGSDEKNGKTTYPSLFGLDRSIELAEESVSKCLESLGIFGREADFLRKLAYYVLHRNS